MISNPENVIVASKRYGPGKKHLLFGVLGLVVLTTAVAVIAIMASGSSALYPVKLNGKYGYIAKSGELVIQPQFDRAGQFLEGRAPVEVGTRWGYIDRTGKAVIAPQFDMADPFADGL